MGFGKSLKKAVKKTVSSVTKAVSSVGGAVVDTVKDAYDKTEGAVSKFVDQSENAVSTAYKQTEKAVSKAYDQTEGAVSDAWHKSGLSDAWDNPYVKLAAAPLLVGASVPVTVSGLKGVAGQVADHFTPDIDISSLSSEELGTGLQTDQSEEAANLSENLRRRLSARKTLESTRHERLGGRSSL